MADFGLGDEQTKPSTPSVAGDLLTKIKPRQKPRSIGNLEEHDSAAATAGFSSREPSKTSEAYKRPRRKRREVEQTYALNMRAPESILKRFIARAEKYGLSYPLTVEKLLDAADELERKKAERS